MFSKIIRFLNDPICFFIKALDLIAAVKGLHELSPQQLGKLIRDSGNNVVRHIGEDGSYIQVIRKK